MSHQRDEIEKCVKEQNIARGRFFEVCKKSYKQIIKSIEIAFVDKSEHWNADIHWVNMGHYKSGLNCVTKTMKSWDWINELSNVLPSPNQPVYVLFEDTKNYRPKYWLYESYIDEIIIILNECVLLGDFYIVSKKFDWLISMNHHDIISYVGKNLKINNTTV